MGGARFPGRGMLSPFASFQRNARLMVLAVFLDGVAISFIQLFFNFFILARGYTVDFLGLANSMSAAAGLALGFPLGRLADRIGFRNSMLLGIAVGYSAFCVVLFTPSPWILLAGMALQGAGGTLFYLSVNPFLMKHSGLRERPLLFSTSVGLQILAGAAGSLIAGQLPAGLMALWRLEPGSAQSYQAVLLTGMVCGSLGLVPLLLTRSAPAPSANPAAEAKAERGAWNPGEKRLLLKMVAPNLIIATGAALLIPYLNLFLRQRFSASDSLLGAIFSFSAVFTGLAAFVSPWLAARLGSKIRAVMFTQSGSLLFLLVLGFVPFFPVAGIAFILRAGLMNMSTPLYSAFCMENTAGGKHGTVSSLIQMAWQAGWTIGPFLSGFVQGRWGFTPLFIATGLLYTAAVLLIGRFFLRLEKDRSMDNPIGLTAVSDGE
jgi:MFS family permease